MQSSTMRGASLRVSPFQGAAKVRPSSRSTVVLVEANKRVQKKTKIILVQDIEGVGKQGEIKQVPVGYWRNYLLPKGHAQIASESVLESIRREKESELRRKLEAKAKAQSLATALSTIAKFTIKKKVGDKDQIYGSVQVSEVADAIYQQTGQKLPEAGFTIPEIKAVGTYECSVQVHPEVTATFSVVVVRDKNVTIKVSEGKKKK